jgi:protein SCO1
VATGPTGALTDIMSKIAARLAALMIAGLLAACGPASQSPPAFKGTDITGAGWGKALELTDHAGRRRTLADFKGKAVLLFLGYTNCPGPCPTALAEMAQVVNQLGREQVQGLFVTVDPERDTPEPLRNYVQSFHPSFLGLRGSKEELEKVTREFKIHTRAQKEEQTGHSGHGAHDPYMVDHSTGIYVPDKSGRARLYFGANDRSVNAMIQDVKLLL